MEAADTICVCVVVFGTTQNSFCMQNFSLEILNLIWKICTPNIEDIKIHSKETSYYKVKKWQFKQLKYLIAFPCNLEFEKVLNQESCHTQLHF